MKLIFVCSPYRGDVEGNAIKAREYCRFVYRLGHVPFAPHLLYTQFLDEAMPEEREAGIRLGLEILAKCDELWLFGDLLAVGMERELREALRLRKQVRYFTGQLDAWDGSCYNVDNNR